MVTLNNSLEVTGYNVYTVTSTDKHSNRETNKVISVNTTQNLFVRCANYIQIIGPLGGGEP